MGDGSAIQWTDATWNPVVGCTRVSVGCNNCYAFALHDRRHIGWKHGRWPDAPAVYHQPFSRVQLLPDRLDQPLRWRKPRRIFVNSMSDLFHEAVPDAFIDRVWVVMALSPQHIFQILTKRPERMAAYLDGLLRWGGVRVVPRWGESIPPRPEELPLAHLRRMPLPNVWLGTSVEDQATAEERIPHLLRTPAAVRFLSCEPLLEPVRLAVAMPCGYSCDPGPHGPDSDWAEGHVDHPFLSYGRRVPELGWVIIGGESGRHARPMEVEWARELLQECRHAGVAVFVKQLGTRWARQHGARHRHGGDWAEWPEDLRVREWPGDAS